MNSKLLLIFLTLFSHFLKAQSIKAEKVYIFPKEISNPSLIHAEYDSSTHMTKLHYVKDNRWENNEWAELRFDSLLGNSGNDIVQVNYTREDYFAKLFPGYRGKEYTEKGIILEEDFKNISLRSGEIYARRKLFHYKWNWLVTDYMIKTEDLDQTMLPKIEGTKYFPVTWYTDLHSGSLYILLAYLKESSMVLTSHNQVLASNYKLFKVNRDLIVNEIASFDFEHTQYIPYFRKIQADQPIVRNFPWTYTSNIQNGKMVIIFSPAQGLTVPNKDSEKGNFTFVCLNNEDKIEFSQKISIPSSGWHIDGVINHKNDYYFWGPAKDNRAINTIDENGTDDTLNSKLSRWNAFQIVKISSGKLSYISNTHWDDFNNNGIKNSEQPKPYYKGIHYHPEVAAVTGEGQLIFGGQNFETGNGAIFYKDILISHFDNNGTLTSTYGLKPKVYSPVGKMHLSPLNIYTGANPDKIYIEVNTLYQLATIYEYKVEDVVLGNPASVQRFNYYPLLVGINLKEKKYTGFTAIGADEKGRPEYFMAGNFSLLKVPASNEVIYIGNNYNAKRLWLARVKFE